MITMYTSYDKEGATKYIVKNYAVYLHRDNNRFYNPV